VALTRISRFNRALIGSAILASALVIAPMAAHAVPATPTVPTTTPQTTGSVTAKLGELAKKNEQLTELLNKAKIDVTQAQDDAAAASRKAAQAQVTLRKAQKSLAAMVSAQYKAPTFSRTAAMLSSNSGQNYLETIQVLNLISDHQTDIARTAAAATDASRKAESAAKSAVAKAIAKRDDVNKQYDSLQGEISKYKSLLATLTAAQRVQYFSQNTAPPAQVAKVIAAPLPPTTSKGAAAAVQAALSRQGMPYVWGAGGPSAFDCSGLTMWAWGQAGVGLPHQSADQQGMLPRVDRSQLQPGDLVFFGSPAYHVGMYIGGGMMVHAPTSGDVVKITSLANMSDYSGAGRPG
jgi:cell wall-associated NlpC family hydrolase